MHELIIKYLEGEATAAGQKALLEWLRQEGNIPVFKNIKQHWALESAPKPMDEEMLRIWSGFQSHMLEQRKQELQKSRFRLAFFRIAAVLAFVAAITTGLLYVLKTPVSQEAIEEMSTSLVADFGQMSKAVLPDGTKVWLNSGSTLTYGNHYGNGHRNLALTGEGFFEVAPDGRLPLNVECKGITIKVTGTTFNVTSYEDYNSVTIALSSGTVELYQPAGNVKVAELAPGQVAFLDRKTGKLDIETANVQRYSAWKEGMVNIYDQTLEELVVRLEKRYNQKFIVEKEIRTLRYTFTIKNEKLSDILALMERITPVKSVQVGDVITFKPDYGKTKNKNQ